jgi:uncharacterized damage-inducible protein DinB
MATDEVSVVREHLERYRGVTLQTLEFVPEDKFDWRPAEKAMTVAEQFVHIARVEEFYARGFFGGVWQFELLSEMPAELTRASLKERLDRGRGYLLEQLGRLEANRMDEIIKVPNVPVDWPLRGWLWYLVEHEIHHKGQLSLYLRQFGVVPPFFAQAFPPGVRPDIR